MALWLGLAAGGALAADATYSVKVLTPETALKAAQAALKSCRERGYQATVAVVDRMGVVQVLLRDRFAGPHTADMATAKAYATDPDSPYVYYYRSLFTKLKRNGRIELFKTRRDQPDDEVTLESVCDKLIIYGTPDSVADQILALQEQVGEFGTLLYAGKDWKDRELGRRSMILMAEKVMPRVNASVSSASKAAE